MSTTTPTPTLREINGRVIPEAGEYELDKAHTAVEFVARHLMISKVRGRFNDFSGVVTVGEKPEDSSVVVTIDVPSVSTGDAQRDGHLLSPDFFDAETYPAITFRSTKVVPVKGGDWKVTGDLTVRDVTKPVVLDVEFEGSHPTPWGTTPIGFSASTELDREDFGLTWNQALETGGVLVGKKIKIELSVEANRK
ncbi:MAG TPA: YceI family protein [Acidimicrobiales bacterium]|nr:YceI family protein [Acidimicrobiales bacterium]